MTLKDIDLSELTIKQGIKITGEASTDHTGWSVSGAGDVNGDGYADFIIGTYNASPLERINAGESYLVFGKKSGLTDIDLRNLTLTQGIKIIGATQGDKSGNAVSSAGDVNGDGYDDVIIAATKKSYLIFGKRYGLTNIDIKNLIISQGITIIGSNIKDTIGWSVSSAGDVNKDGYDDLIIGSHYENILGHNSAGESYLIFGKKNLTDIDLVYLFPPQGIKIQGSNTNDESGCSVSSAGDVNNDGYNDIIIGARYATPLERTNAGESYLIFGKSNGFAGITLKNLALPQGIKILGANSGDNSGWAVSGAGDVNNDGYDDIIIGARYANPLERTNAGVTYLIFGKSDGFTNLDLRNLALPQGIKILGANSGDNSGWAVSGAGDVNNDGYDDIIIGATGAPAGTLKGETYLIFGKNTTNFTDIDLKNLTLPQGIKIIGANTNDTSGSSVSSAGDVNNDGYDDMIIGASDITSLEQYEAGKSYLIFGDESNVPSAPTTTAPTIAPTTTPTTAPTTTAPTTAPTTTTTAPTATAPTTAPTIAPTTTAPTAYTPPTSTPDNNDLNKYEIIGISIFGVVAFGSLMFYGYKYIKNLEAYTTRNTVHQTLIGANEHTRTSYSNLDDISLEDA